MKAVAAMIVAAHLASAPSVSGLGESPFARCEARPGMHHPLDRGVESRCIYQVVEERRELTEEGLLALTRLAEESSEEGWTWFYLGSLQWHSPEAGGGEAARGSFQEAALAFENAGDRRGGLYALHNLQRLQRESGRNLAELYDELVELEAALPSQSDGLSHQHRDYLIERTRSLRAGVAYDLGRWEEARTDYERLLELVALDRLAERAEIHLNLALTTLAENPAGDTVADARWRLQQAIELAEAVGDAVVEIKARRTWGRLEGGDAGRAMIEQALIEAERLEPPDPVLLSELQGLVARLSVRDDPARARDLLAESMRNALKTPGSLTHLAHAWHDRLTVAWALGGEDELDAEVERSLGLHEFQRRLQASDQGRGNLFGVWSEGYAWSAGRTLSDWIENGDRRGLEQAFAIHERMRARVLQETRLASLGSAPPVLDEVAAAEAQVLLERLRALEAQRFDPDLDSEGRADLESRIVDLEERLEAVSVRAGGWATESARRLRFPTLPEIEAALGPDEALLSFQVALSHDVYGDFVGGSWLIAVTPQGSKAYELTTSDSEGLLRIERFVELVEAGHDIRHPATRIYEDLLGEALRDLPPRVRKLTLVPDGILHRVPFSSLRPSPEASPLAAEWELVVAPSAGLWLEWRNDGGGDLSSASLVLADPASSEPPPRNAATRGGGSPDPLPALRFARQEGRHVRRLLGAELLLGSQASEAALKAWPLEDLGVVHFGTHSRFDGIRPEKAAVILSPGHPGEDGRLQPREIAALPLRDSLVFLATCSGNRGETLRGEGVMSLARSFFQAGARTVIATLWDVDDRESADLAERFYSGFRRGLPASTALRQAKEAARHAGTSERTWAAYVLIGDGSATIEARPDRHPRWALPIGLLLSLGLAFWWFARRKAQA